MFTGNLKYIGTNTGSSKNSSLSTHTHIILTAFENDPNGRHNAYIKILSKKTAKDRIYNLRCLNIYFNHTLLAK